MFLGIADDDKPLSLHPGITNSFVLLDGTFPTHAVMVWQIDSCLPQLCNPQLHKRCVGTRPRTILLVVCFCVVRFVLGLFSYWEGTFIPYHGSLCQPTITSVCDPWNHMKPAGTACKFYRRAYTDVYCIYGSTPGIQLWTSTGSVGRPSSFSKLGVTPMDHPDGAPNTRTSGDGSTSRNW